MEAARGLLLRSMGATDGLESTCLGRSGLSRIACGLRSKVALLAFSWCLLSGDAASIWRRERSFGSFRLVCDFGLLVKLRMKLSFS
jgi:hypothetical protein